MKDEDKFPEDIERLYEQMIKLDLIDYENRLKKANEIMLRKWEDCLNSNNNNKKFTLNEHELRNLRGFLEMPSRKGPWWKKDFIRYGFVHPQDSLKVEVKEVYTYIKLSFWTSEYNLDEDLIKKISKNLGKLKIKPTWIEMSKTHITYKIINIGNLRSILSIRETIRYYELCKKIGRIH